MQGEKITIQNGNLNVPSRPIIPFIEGDGIGPDIWAAAVRVIDAAVAKAYHGERKIMWKEVYAGEKANEKMGSYLPEETLDAMNEHLVGIKGPLTTPVGGGFRSLNVALRQKLDLYACVRPVRWFEGVPSPVKKPENVDMVIFRENTEDIYAGIEYNHGTPEVEQVKDFLINEMGVSEIRFPRTASIGIKPVSKEGTERLIHAAMEYTIAKGRKSLTIVHKGNIMKFTEGMFKQWAYDYCEATFGDKAWTWQQYDRVKEESGVDAANAAQKAALDGGAILVKDSIADAFLQQILLRPLEYDVIATLNLNGDYISDALAAMVGGIGIAPGANINYTTGVSLFEATHGTAPKYKGMDKVNPSSVILSAVMMLDYMGWSEAGDIIEKGIEGAIGKKRVTYDFERLMEGATTLKCSEFGSEIIENMPTPIAFENESNFETPESQPHHSVSESNDVNVESNNNNISTESYNLFSEEDEVISESPDDSNSNEINPETNTQEEVSESRYINPETNTQEEVTESRYINPETNSDEEVSESRYINPETNSDEEISESNDLNPESNSHNEITESHDSISKSNNISTESYSSNVESNEASTETYNSSPESNNIHTESNDSNHESTDFNNVTSHVVSSVEQDPIPVVHDSGEVSNEETTESYNVSSETLDASPVAYDSNSQPNEVNTESNNESLDTNLNTDGSSSERHDASVVLDDLISKSQNANSELHDATSDLLDASDVSTDQ